MTRLRIGVVGADAAGVAAIGSAIGRPDLVDVRLLPDVVHLLLVPGGLARGAVPAGTRARVVVVLPGAGPDPGVPDAAWDGLGTDLVVASITGPGDDAGTVLRRVVDALVDGQVLGDALVAALGDVTPLAGDGGLLGRADLGALLDPFGGRGAGAEPPATAAPPDDVPAAPEPAPAPPEPSPAPPDAVPAPEPTDERWLQCTVAARSRAVRESLPPNAFGVGRNTVTVFIDLPRPDAIMGSALTNAAMGFTPAVDDVRLRVVLIPLSPRGAPRRGVLRVPRTGSSTEARLTLDVPPGTREVSARLLVLHRNRVLSTAVLTAPVGQPARLGEHALVRPTLTGLRERRRFDAAVVANHDAGGRPGLMGYRDGRATSVDVAAFPGVETAVARIRELLVDAARLPARRGADPQAWTRREVELLVDLAMNGRDLHAFLEGALLPFGGDLRRIQIVTAQSGTFLPLELAYTRPAPDVGATLCPSWAAGGDGCGPGCGAGPDDTSIVCPAAFLGVRATVERHYLDGLAGADGRQHLTTVTPVARRRRLTVRHGVLAASDRVKATDADAILAALDGEARQARDWTEWTQALAAADTDLLVLLPHTNVRQATLEVSGATLARGRIEARHVTGGREVHPVVLLLGCDTAGCKEDPAGFATRFLARDAAVVLSSLTELLPRHAARMAGLLSTALREAAADRRRTPVGELVTAFRRDALAGGLLAALGVAAYGDADWTV